MAVNIRLEGQSPVQMFDHIVGVCEERAEMQEEAKSVSAAALSSFKGMAIAGLCCLFIGSVTYVASKKTYGFLLIGLASHCFVYGVGVAVLSGGSMLYFVYKTGACGYLWRSSKDAVVHSLQYAEASLRVKELNLELDRVRRELEGKSFVARDHHGG